jgi:acyl-CoA thioesterase FadM
MTMRFRASAQIGQTLTVTAAVQSARSRLVQTVCELRNGDGELIATAAGKYVPMRPEDSARFMDTFVRDPHTDAARKMLLGGAIANEQRGNGSA